VSGLCVCRKNHESGPLLVGTATSWEGALQSAITRSMYVLQVKWRDTALVYNAFWAG